MKVNIEKDENLGKETYVVDLYEYMETPYIEREEVLKNVGCPAYLDDPRVRKFIVGGMPFYVYKYDKDGKCAFPDDEEMMEPYELRISPGDGNMIDFEIVSPVDSSKITFMINEFKLMSILSEIMRLKHTG